MRWSGRGKRLIYNPKLTGLWFFLKEILLCKKNYIELSAMKFKCSAPEWFSCPEGITPNSGLTGANNTIYIYIYNQNNYDEFKTHPACVESSVPDVYDSRDQLKKLDHQKIIFIHRIDMIFKKNFLKNLFFTKISLLGSKLIEKNSK